jgi:uncharacterized protein YkwD
VGVKTYTDGATGGKYAVMLYDDASGVAAARVFTADAAEQFLFHTINAFRYLNSRTALVWNAKLGASARAHTAEMGAYNYLSETGRNGSTFATRASSQGYESSLVSFGAVAGGGANIADFLNDYVNASGKRSQMLGTALTVAGTGFGSGYSGGYNTLGTVVFGTLIGITNVTWTPSTVAVNVGGTASVTLTVTPSTRNETFTVASSNTAYATVTNTAYTPTALTVTGRAQGSVSVTVTGNSSGNVYTIPISVGTVYATSLTIRNESNTLVANSASSSISNAGNYILGKGSTYQFTATTAPSTASAAVTWTSSNTSVATVSSAGLVTGVNNGTATITARMQRSASSSDYITVTIYFTVASLTLQSASGNVSGGAVTLDMLQSNSISITPSVAGLPTGASVTGYTGSSSYPSIAVVNPSSVNSNTPVSIEGKAPGSARITVVAAITYNTVSYSYISKVTGYVNVSVTGQSQYATDFTLNPSALTVEIGQTKEINISVTPAYVANKQLTIDGRFEAYKDYADITIDNSAGKIYVTGKAATPAASPATVYVNMPAGGVATIDKSFTVTVTPVAITGIVINDGAASAAVTSGSTITLTYKIIPAYASQTADVVWNSDSEGVATVDSSGVVTPLSNGQAIITARINGTLISDMIGVEVSGFAATQPST